MKSIKIFVIFLVGILYLSFVSCGQKTEKAPVVGRQPIEIEKISPKEAWQTQWEQVQRDARKEGKVILYTTLGAELREALREALLKEYGINLESLSLRPAELQERLLRESRAGINYADFAMAGLATFYPGMKSAELLAPLEPLLILPEVKDPKVWYKGELPFVDRDKTIINFAAFPIDTIQINTNLVKPGDLNTVQDLLSSRWQGKIIMDDPTVVGRSNQLLSILYNTLGEDYLKQLAKMNPVIMRDPKFMIDGLAKERYSIGIGMHIDLTQEYIQAGAPIKRLFILGSVYLTSGAAYIVSIKGGPHPNGQRVFLNWLLSKKGGMLWTKNRLQQSARTDIPEEYLNDIKAAGVKIREPGVDYFDTISEKWVVEERPKADKIIREHFAPLLR